MEKQATVTVDDARFLRAAMEMAIENVIRRFEAQTGCPVSSVTLDVDMAGDASGKCVARYYRIKCDVKL
jgi:hypothetical protein